MDLYFLAIVPDTRIQEEVSSFKKDLCLRFQSCHALNAPPHITLQMPFRRDAFTIAKLTVQLKEFALQKEPFNIRLKNFNHFNDSVLYVALENLNHLLSLHRDLQELLSITGFSKKELNQRFHPHMTIAHRDLSPENFKKAWREYSQKNYFRQFKATQLHLLKHNENQWLTAEQFNFTGVV